MGHAAQATIATQALTDSNSGAIALSFVIPVYNEQESISALFQEIKDTMHALRAYGPWEVLFVDDGSSDGSVGVARMLVDAYPGLVRLIRLRSNTGKAAALSAGFSVARGQWIVTMDADLQDDVTELPKLFEKIRQGYDLVSGWKKHRQDPVSKTLPSKLFNWVTCRATGLDLHDLNTGFKLYRRAVLPSLRLYGHRHRYIPVLAADMGFKVAETPVHHRPRTHGKSKYGALRFVHGLIDLLSVLTLTRFLQRPAHLFGGIGVTLGTMGLASLTYLFVLWLFAVSPIGTRPLLIFGVMTVILSVQFISFGLLAELMVHNTQARRVEDRIAEITPLQE